MRQFRRYFWRLSALLALLAVLLGLTVFHFSRQILTVDTGMARADVLVVLGGGLRERPERAERAAELFQEGEALRIICTGTGDALANEDCLTNHGVPLADIWLEPKSRSTRENAKFTIALLREQHLKSAIIVTSWYHSRRALACFEHFAPDLKFYSRPARYDDAMPNRIRRTVNHYVMNEYVKIAGYWACYGVCPW